MSETELQSRLTETCEMMFGPQGNNILDDTNGNLISAQNRDRSVWLLPGTRNRAITSERTITIPHGKSLFITVASTHATPEEFRNARGHNPTPGELDAFAECLANLWDTVGLSYTINGQNSTTEGKSSLKKIKVSIPQIHIADNNYYTVDYSVSGGDTNMVSIAYVKVFENLPRGSHTIKLEARASPDRGEGCSEAQYRIEAHYRVIVQ